MNGFDEIYTSSCDTQSEAPKVISETIAKGYYWVLADDEWDIKEWDGIWWWSIGSETAFPIKDIQRLGSKIDPPQQDGTDTEKTAALEALARLIVTGARI